MATAPHIERALDRIGSEIALCTRAAFLHHMFNGAAECARADGWSRGVTLERNEIADASHEAVIAAVRQRLAINREVKRERPGAQMAPALE